MKRVFTTILSLILVAGLSAVKAEGSDSSSAPVTPAGQQPPRAARAEGKVKDAHWMTQHEQFLQDAKAGPVDVVFLGDSITAMWRSVGKPIFDQCYTPLHALNLGIGGDYTQSVLWRLENGEVDGLHPKVVVVMIGTNNSGDKPENIAAGITAIVKDLREKLPNAKVLLLAIFPRGVHRADWAWAGLDKVNKEIAKLDDGNHVKYLDIGQAFLEPDGTIAKTVMPDTLHPTAHGFYLWAKAMNPTLATMLGAKIAEPTDPSQPASPKR